MKFNYNANGIGVKQPFQLYSKQHDILFSFGEKDIVVLKKDVEKLQSSCYQKSFDYKGKTKALVDGKLNTVPFTPKRHMLWRKQFGGSPGKRI